MEDFGSLLSTNTPIIGAIKTLLKEPTAVISAEESGDPVISNIYHMIEMVKILSAKLVKNWFVTINDIFLLIKTPNPFCLIY